MTIKKFILLGDTHGANVKPARQARRVYPDLQPNEIGLIILGDAGFNCGRPEEDAKWKKVANKIGVQIFCVRGNHDEHPTYLENVKLVYNDDINGLVYWQEEYKNIFYLLDGATYNIDGLNTLVVGGAYSIDKPYRLENNMFWESREQISQGEWDIIKYTHFGHHYDLVLTHTCTLSWQPKDLFLSFIDQSEVDNTMEIWFEELKNNITFDMWYFGHYHADRLVRPGVQMLYHIGDPIECAKARWIDKDPEYLIGWAKDPNYYL